VVCHIDYLNLITQLTCIIGQNTRKEKLLIVGVGRQQQQVSLITGRLPDLDPVRQSAFTKAVYICYLGTG
jgi:hypothetical protein